MRYLHTMLRVKDLDESVAFYKLLGLQEFDDVTAKRAVILLFSLLQKAKKKLRLS